MNISFKNYFLISFNLLFFKNEVHNENMAYNINWEYG